MHAYVYGCGCECAHVALVTIGLLLHSCFVVQNRVHACSFAILCMLAYVCVAQ